MMNSNTIRAEVVVLGGGPGGYSAAFRAADLGKKVILIERYDSLGGVCLNVGCIPSKMLLHIAKVVNEARCLKNDELIDFDYLKFNNNKIMKYKNDVIHRLSMGLRFLANQRNIEVINGYGKFLSSNTISVAQKKNTFKVVNFDNVIIGVGSSPIMTLSKCC